ncbi:MAG: hypothetical protein WCP21_21200 [Armatimonadota bacterium]
MSLALQSARSCLACRPHRTGPGGEAVLEIISVACPSAGKRMKVALSFTALMGGELVAGGN